MWNDTEEYKQIIRSAEKWNEIKETVHIRAIWVRANGEYQEKEGNFWNAVEWLEDNFETYWPEDEAEVKVFIEDEVFYWKHPELSSSLTVEEIERQDDIAEDYFKKSAIYLDNNTITFGAING